MPPEAIADVLSAVLMLLGINDTSWLSMKKFLMNRGVKDEILNFDAHRITPEIRKVRTQDSNRSRRNLLWPDPYHRGWIFSAPDKSVQHTRSLHLGGRLNEYTAPRSVQIPALLLTPFPWQAVSNHVRQKQSSFEKETITRVSVAAAPLAIWVKANIKYSIVLEKIEPLEGAVDYHDDNDDDDEEEE
jgi:hypothetical protein